jgi:hypothetical protein
MSVRRSLRSLNVRHSGLTLADARFAKVEANRANPRFPFIR